MSVNVLPETAPFSGQQRAWLNGFFAGILGMDELQGGAGANGLNGAAPSATEDEDYPWHDATLTLPERLQLSEGKPLDQLLMSAMAQQDCGQCGYLCKTYSQAIYNGTEKSLTKCVPGGKETSKKLKELIALNPLPAAGNAFDPVNEIIDKPAQGRQYAFPARLLESRLMNKPGSDKEVRFVSFDLTGSGISYQVGDALSVYPENCPELVDEIIRALDATGAEHVGAPDQRAMSLREALLTEYDIVKPNEELLTLLAKCARDDDEADALKGLLDDWGTRDVLDLLLEFPSARPAKRSFVRALAPLQPRLYSISSSQNAHPNEVHLTVATVRYRLNERQRKGVASTFLAERVDEQVRLMVQSAPHFRLPAKSDTPIIMVGPGTGIAPFRAFLEERKAQGVTGKNWLFFGDQRSKYDYLYQDELEAYLAEGLLTRLDTAFSRDQADKIYVQQRMLEQAEDLWDWLQEGAYFYVCGDAKRMARDVDQALQSVAAEQGRMAPLDAKAYVANLSKQKRYVRDVY